MHCRNPRIARDGSDLTEEFEVVHPFHPLRGERFELLNYGPNWGEERVTFRDGKGRLHSLPAGWTSVVPADPFVAISAGRSLFRAQDLLALAALIREISERVVEAEV